MRLSVVCVWYLLEDLSCLSMRLSCVLHVCGTYYREFLVLEYASECCVPVVLTGGFIVLEYASECCVLCVCGTYWREDFSRLTMRFWEMLSTPSRLSRGGRFADICFCGCQSK